MAVGLGIIFEKQNVAFMVGLAFCVAASCNFPILLLSMYWKGLTTRGALWGGGSGLVLALVLVIIGPTVWVDALGNKEAIIPIKTLRCFRFPSPLSSAGLFPSLINPLRRRRKKSYLTIKMSALKRASAFM